MNDAPPVDEADRTRVRTGREQSLVVEAGAGSGKTSAIVGRIEHLVRNGEPISSIVAVTFTEAAAAELRARIRLALERLVAEGHDEVEVAAAASALVDLEDAEIGTLHSWARRIIAEFPLELGLPPRFDVLDETQTSIERSRSWRALSTELFSDPALASSIMILEGADYRTRRLRDVYEELCDNVDRLDAGDVHDVADPPVEPSLDIVEAIERIDAAIAHGTSCADPEDPLAQALAHWDELGDLLAALDDDLERLAVLDEKRPRFRGLGRKGNWQLGVDKDTVIAALAAADEALDAARSAYVGTALHNVLRRILDRVLHEAAVRRRTGRLQFTDLLVLAAELLRTHPAARRRHHERSRRVLVDEFQDTDPIQAEIATLVVTDADDVADRAWWELPVPEGSLVIVGDPKQSIYRFRRADLSLFATAKSVHASGEVTFRTNFRSRPGIVAWVDAVIGPDLATGHERDPDLQAAHVALEPHRSGVDGCPVRIFGNAHANTTMEDVRTAEAADIAALLAEVRTGRFTVGDPGQERPAGLADVAVLLPTRITLPYLEHALADADIPVRIESQSLVLSTEVVRELLVLLEAIVDPNDTVAIVAALRSNAIACRDDELARHALGGGTWRYLAEQPEDAPPTIVDGLAVLRDLHGRAPGLGVDGAVEHVIRSCRILELGVAARRPRDQWRRALHVADLARSYVEGGGTSLREFTRWLRERADDEFRSVEVPVPEPDDDAVRILTVHGAKGLEFPITVLAGLSVVDRTPPRALLWRDGSSPVVTAAAVRPPDYAELADAEVHAAAEEAKRLLYVATTRARDHLFVSVHRKDSARDNSPAARIATSCEGLGAEGEDDLWVRWTPPEAPTPAARAAEHDPFDRGAFHLGEWETDHARALATGAGVAAIAATALARQADDEPFEDAPTHRRGRAGTAIGRAVHATLQSVDLATGAGLAPTARAQAYAEGVPEHTAEIEALASSALRAPVVMEALASGRHWREVPVGATVDGVVVEGFVDLLVETPEGLVVVDWKTDRIGGRGDAETRMEHYRIQGAAYALAIEAALERPVVRCVFVFTDVDGALELEVEDLPGALADARMRISEHAGT